MAYVLSRPAIWAAKKMQPRISTPHVEMPKETIDLITKQKSGILYVGSHKSLWEAVGIPLAINEYTDDIPRVVMAYELIGAAFHPLFRSMKVIIHKRGQPVKLYRDLLDTFEDDSALLFAEGSRSRKGTVKDFFAAGMQAPITCSAKNDTYIIPVNADYSFVNEEKRLLGKKSSKHYKFYAHHFFEWVKNVGDVYISFGEPIKVSPNDDARILADICKSKCLDLVKILPVNVVAEAVNRNSNMEQSLSQVLSELTSYADRFRGFTLDSKLSDIIKMSELALAPNPKSNLPELDFKSGPKSNLYAGYISHYFLNNRAAIDIHG